MQFGVREVTAAQVARVLGMMARTHSGLTDGIPLQVSVAIKYFIKWINVLPFLFYQVSMIVLSTQDERMQ